MKKFISYGKNVYNKDEIFAVGKELPVILSTLKLLLRLTVTLKRYPD